MSGNRKREPDKQKSNTQKRSNSQNKWKMYVKENQIETENGETTRKSENRY